MEFRKVTVVGAGNMGSGIAQACAAAGLDVVLCDLNADLVKKGLARIEGPLRKRVEQGKMPAAEVDALLARIRGETDRGRAVAQADLVIEAVFEDLKVKRDVFAEVARAAKPECVFATNTSSLAVSDIAEATDRPTRVAGLHFFFPAAINKLVEVVGGARTEPAVVDALMAFSRRIGKVPIRTKDANGFAVNRFFVPWVNESVRILEEGVADVPTIEAAAKEAFEISMGPFELMNVTGVPISLHAQTSLHKAFGRFYEPAKRLAEQVAKAQNWELAGTPDPAKMQAVKDRLLGVVFGIAGHLVEEGVATAEDTDKGATVGLRWAKGPFAMVNAAGTPRALALVEKLHARWGDAFAVPKTLARVAREGRPWPLSLVRSEMDGAVALLTIDRPDALNALNEDVLADLERAVDAAFVDPAVRAIVLTGEGKAFVAGADIKAMAGKSPIEARGFTQLGQRVFRGIAEGPKPVLAAVNGFALGGGCELALACDVVLASDKAQFGLPEVGLGIIPGFGGTQRLTRLVGPQKAKWLVFTTERLSAQQAADLGLVTKVVPHADLLREAKAMAAKIAEQGPIAIQLAKQAINRALDTDLAGGLAFEAELAALTFATDDQKEAMRAFVEKRKPRFAGR